MAGGFKDFVAGNVLAESDLDNYLMRQTVMQFASAAARNSALSGSLVEGMFADLADVDALTRYNGSSWDVIYQTSTSFTPSWTNLTIGNGTQSGSYVQLGKVVFGFIDLTFGSSTSIGGSVSVAVPTGTQTFINQGEVRYLDASASTSFIGTWRAASSSIGLNIHTVSGSQIVSNVLSSTVPFTWTTSDKISFGFYYLIT